MSESDTDEIDADALIDMMDKDNMIDIVLRIMPRSKKKSSVTHSQTPPSTEHAALI